MPELLLELFSEEIPARMQARAAEDLVRLVSEALAPLTPSEARGFSGPRRIAMAATLADGVAESRTSERGPRVSAPEQALAGFLRKHGAAREQLRQEGEFWVLERVVSGIDAKTLVAREIPGVPRRFPWPKSMRWGGTSAFTWVRPLRRILCILDGDVVPFDLRDGDDDGHGLSAGNVTEGHRFLAPDPFTVRSAADWREKLLAHGVIVDAADRRGKIMHGLRDLAESRGLTVVEDAGLLDEVAGLVEWPVPLLGRIDAAYMGLPPEVMQVSMRVNQRYFALRDAEGRAAPWFAFAANIAATDGGAAIIAGNERVLRARFADARHFWDLDRKQTLESRVAALDAVTFHAKLGSQGDRVRRLVRLAGEIAPLIGADVALVQRAALLAKADLTTGMVGEFPELQGVMGRYYALHDGESEAVADAIRDHYAPKGPADTVPTDRVSISVALADKIGTLAGFFAIGEKPTGAGDPYALRRAALGVIRIVRENRLRLYLRLIIQHEFQAVGLSAISGGAEADEPNAEPSVKLVVPAKAAIQGRGLGGAAPDSRFRGNDDSYHDLENEPAAWEQNPKSSEAIKQAETEGLLAFLAERLRVQLRAEGARHDVLAAVLGTGLDDDLIRLLARTDAVADLLGTDDGKNLLAGYKRAANILRIEEKKDGPHGGAVDVNALERSEEVALAAALDAVGADLEPLIAAEDFSGAMSALATLRPPLDAFFENVTVNDPRPDLRRNRLRLLSRVRAAMHLAADFSKIEG
jgi:glycyl-tRNA synthetase beta chain